MALKSSSLYKMNDIRVTFNRMYKRLSITKGSNFVSLGAQGFKMLLMIIQEGSRFATVSMSQATETIEIISLSGNIAISSHTSRNLSSRVNITREEALELHKNREHLF